MESILAILIAERNSLIAIMAKKKSSRLLKNYLGFTDS